MEVAKEVAVKEGVKEVVKATLQKMCTRACGRSFSTRSADDVLASHSMCEYVVLNAELPFA